jgi:hypothetical protein
MGAGTGGEAYLLSACSCAEYAHRQFGSQLMEDLSAASSLSTGRAWPTLYGS